MEADITADHQSGQRCGSRISDVNSADVLTLTDNGAAVCDFHNFCQLVGDEQDALALCCQVLHDLQQFGNFLGRQHSGGFVENQNLVVAVQHLQDLGTLLHTNGDVLNDRIRVNVQAILFGKFHDLLSCGTLIQQTMLHRLNAHDDIVQNGEAFDQLEVLVDHADAQIICVIGIADLDFLAVLLNDTFLRCIKTKQHAHQSGLACTVFTKQCMNLALLQLERDVIVGNNTREFFGDV